MASAVYHALLPWCQAPKPSIDQLLGFHWPSPISDPKYGILDIDAVARHTDIEWILQLHSLLKLPLAEWRQGPSQEHEWTAQVAEEH
jgi:hypothetical protein